MNTPLPNPFRVAVVGSGPSGFYVVQALLKEKIPGLEVDIFDRLPVPYGLVRYGVAPDHQKIKNVTKVYARLATDPAVRFYGNVEIGSDITVEEMREHYHQIAFCSGAQSDRRLGIPGEDLEGSHPATEFVAWYNGHPDHRDREYDLSCERAVVVGVGNVAVDVARILCRTPEELLKTDIADHALEALRHSKIREVVLMGRRGPAQAAFTNSEIEEIGELEDAETFTKADEVALDPLSVQWLEANPDRQITRKVEVIQSYAVERETKKSKSLSLRFLLSPAEIHGDEAGKVRGVRAVRNLLHASGDGSLRPRPTETFEEIDAGLVFRSVGYRGVPVPGVPFREDWGIAPNDEGRILDAPDGSPVQGLYVAGWYKRGPSGVIGTNRPDSAETAIHQIEDAKAGLLGTPAAPSREALEARLRERNVRFVSFDEWSRLDSIELERGAAAGRPRTKLVSRDEIFSALDA